MQPSRRTLIVSFCLALCAIPVYVWLRSQPVRQPPASDRALYHPDPKHLWNRLHEAIFVRAGTDGVTYGRDRLEPLLWTESRHLLAGPSHERAVEVLRQFLDERGEKVLTDPLKRAVLQRDLWLVFDWLEGSDAGPERDLLRKHLAAVIGRLALSPEVLKQLPDNTTDAPGDLPRDLFADGGLWVCVARTDGPTAPQHLRDEGTNRFINSTFLVFLRLPAGREATLAYLKRLLAFDGPLMIKPDKALEKSAPFVPNPDVPQFPKGTIVALVRRRALLIDSSHRITPSPLTESVQLRVLHGEPPAITKEVVEDATRYWPPGVKRIESWQTSHEARLSRADLFAGTGGLRDVSDERDFKTGFGSHPFDEFERERRPDQSFTQLSQPFTPRQTCVFCHGLPGVFAFNSYQDFRSGLGPRGGSLRPLPLAATPVPAVEAAAVRWKEGRPSWVALRALLPM